MPPKQVLPRALSSLSIGAVQSMQRKRKQDSEYDLIEVELQYQIAVTGDAGIYLAWAMPVTIDFEWGFHYAPMQRDSELELPHFTYGAYVVTPTPVGVLACVSGWHEEPRNGAITGVDLSIGFVRGQGGVVADDGAAADAAVGDATIPFKGTLHASFQGLAQSLDDTSQNPDLEVTA